MYSKAQRGECQNLTSNFEFIAHGEGKFTEKTSFKCHDQALRTIYTSLNRQASKTTRVTMHTRNSPGFFYEDNLVSLDFFPRAPPARTKKILITASLQETFQEFFHVSLYDPLSHSWHPS